MMEIRMVIFKITDKRKSKTANDRRCCFDRFLDGSDAVENFGILLYC